MKLTEIEKNMINVMVSYRVNPDFVEENKVNIEKFLESFKDLDHKKFTYSVFLNHDGVSFTHISHYEDKDIQQEVLNTPSFIDFQRKRDESGLDDSHSVQMLQYIGSTTRIL